MELLTIWFVAAWKLIFLSFWNARASTFLRFDRLYSACFEGARCHEEEGPNFLNVDSCLLNEASSHFLSPLCCCLCNLVVLKTKRKRSSYQIFIVVSACLRYPVYVASTMLLCFCHDYESETSFLADDTKSGSVRGHWQDHPIAQSAFQCLCMERVVLHNKVRMVFCKVLKLAGV